MKLFGHPIHLMVVHFPAALFPFDLVCSVLAVYRDDESLLLASFYGLAGGVILGWVAIVFGSLDIVNLVGKKSEVVTTAILHGALNSFVVFAYTVLLYAQTKHFSALAMDATLTLIIKACLVLFMGFGNYLGGSLILRYKVGIEND